METINENVAYTGDVSVGHDFTVGGDVEVRGGSVFGHDVTIKGWLDARNIKHPCKGMYASVENLKAAYPSPLPGWFALVGDTLPADVYRAWDGEWEKTTEKSGVFDVELNVFQDDITSLKNKDKELEDNKLNKTDVIDNLTSSDGAKALSAKQGKKLQDEKLAKTEASNTYATKESLNSHIASATTNYYINVPVAQELGEISDNAKITSMLGKPSAIKSAIVNEQMIYGKTEEGSSGFGHSLLPVSAMINGHRCVLLNYDIVGDNNDNGCWSVELNVNWTDDNTWGSLTGTAYKMREMKSVQAQLQSDIEGIESTLDEKLDKEDVIDNLTTNNGSKALSAKQGKALKNSQDRLSKNLESTKFYRIPRSSDKFFKFWEKESLTKTEIDTAFGNYNTFATAAADRQVVCFLTQDATAYNHSSGTILHEAVPLSIGFYPPGTDQYHPSAPKPVEMSFVTMEGQLVKITLQHNNYDWASGKITIEEAGGVTIE